MKMYDLGVEEQDPDITADSIVESTRAYKPEMRISEGQCPDLKGLQVGQTIVLCIECTVTSLDLPNEFDSRKGLIVGLRVDRCGKEEEKDEGQETVDDMKMPGRGRMKKRMLMPAPGLSTGLSGGMGT